MLGLASNTETASEAADRAAENYEKLHEIMEQLRGSAELTGEALAASARNIIAIAESRVTTIEGRIREAYAAANALAQTADPETAFLADTAAQQRIAALRRSEGRHALSGISCALKPASLKEKPRLAPNRSRSWQTRRR